MDESLDIILADLAYDLTDAREETTANSQAREQTSARLDAVEERLELLAQQLPANAQDSTATRAKDKTSSPLRLVSSSATNRSDATNTTTWEALQQAAEQRLKERGLDAESASIDGILDDDVRLRIEQQYSGEFQLQANLDRYDVAASIAAGIAAALVDFIGVRIPQDHTYLGTHEQSGSPVTKWMQSKTDPDKHWIARIAKRLEDQHKVSFDAVRKVTDKDLVNGFHIRSHRFQTPGHDPLLGLLFGTIDVMRGGLTAISRDGIPVLISGADVAGGLRPPVANAFLAFWKTLMHLASDFPTKMGLPAPGFTMLPAFDIGSFGAKDRTIGELARFMYLKGYDSRHFLTMSTSVAAAEIILRGYYFMRRHFDQAYDAEIRYAAEVAGEKSWRYNRHPKFMGMKVIAHAIGAAANAGKIASYGGNPLAVNYVQWLSFIKDALRFIKLKARSPSEVIQGYAYANARILDQGWEDSLFDDPDFPELKLEAS